MYITIKFITQSDASKSILEDKNEIQNQSNTKNAAKNFLNISNDALNDVKNDHKTFKTLNKSLKEILAFAYQKNNLVQNIMKAKSKNLKNCPFKLC